MLLVTWPSHEFARFVQVSGLIVLPVLTVILLLTIFIHYRKKKKSRDDIEETEADFVLASPEQFAHKKEEGEYVFFDHSGLIKEYKKRMFYNHARFLALKKDYASLEIKYSSVQGNDTASLTKKNKVSMKNSEETALQPVHSFPEKEELLAKLGQLNKSHSRLEEENRFLQEQISMQSGGDEEKEKTIAAWKEERKLLKDKILEQEYLGELLNEKKSQIDFLQNQVEQRIKSQHAANQERQQAVVEMEKSVQQLEVAKNELMHRQETTDKLQTAMADKEELLTLKDQQLNEKQDRITYLENALKEIKEQNELLNAEAMDNRDIAMTLREEADKERERVKFLEQKLEKNRQTLRHLYKEISGCVDAEQGNPPVIEMKPAFKNAEKNMETIIH